MGVPYRKRNMSLQIGMNLQRECWIQRSKDRFHQLILQAEGRPSVGTVRKVDRPDGETRFSIVYGEGPDRFLRMLLKDIYAKYGEVDLLHDGRDSTGKHWIKCMEKASRPWTFPTEKVLICVFSKAEQATVASLQAREAARKQKKNKDEKATQWPPKVPGQKKHAPEHLFLMPWYRQLPWLEPEAAQALRERMEARRLVVGRVRSAPGESPGGSAQAVRRT